MEQIHITDEEMIDKICSYYEEKIGIKRNNIVFKRVGTENTTWKDLFEALFTTDDKQQAASYLNYKSEKSLESALARQKVNGITINGILNKKSSKSWKNWFPEALFNIKYCTDCKCYYSLDYFNELKRGSTPQKEKEYRTKCMDCYSKHHTVSVKSYKKKNPEKIAANNALRRAAWKGSKVKTEKHEKLYTLCRKLEEDIGIKFHVDHIVPLAKGGSHDIENLQIITQKENLHKCAKTQSEWETTTVYKTLLKEGHIWRIDTETEEAIQLQA